MKQDGELALGMALMSVLSVKNLDPNLVLGSEQLAGKLMRGDRELVIPLNEVVRNNGGGLCSFLHRCDIFVHWEEPLSFTL